MSYKHITCEQRIELSALLKAGVPKTLIALQLGLHRSTLWREIRRNKGHRLKYDVRVAQANANRRRRYANEKGDKIKNDKKLRNYIFKKLKLYWSPEQIAGRLKLSSSETVICHETIYRFIYRKAPELIIYLRHQKNKYRKRHGSKKRMIRAREMNKKRIDQRPAIVETRERIGDWEGDIVVGSERYMGILTHVERKSGYLLADKLKRTHAEHVRQVTAKRFGSIPLHQRLTVTYDNGLSFAEHSITERETNIAVYFAHPYHSWERGTNENTNGLLRQFYPKRTPFKGLTQEKLDKIVSLINNRPRKRLRYRTPQEVFSECCT
jgi:IS30 family transposase